MDFWFLRVYNYRYRECGISGFWDGGVKCRVRVRSLFVLMFCRINIVICFFFLKGD